MNICSENSFIIHSRDYGETSLIFEVITENIGPFTLLGKGVKKKKDFSILQPFKELKITFSKKSNLPILAKYEIVQNFSVIKNNFLLYGIYMNELIHKFLPQREPCQAIYNLYKKALLNVSDNISNFDKSILNFEVIFLKEIGYEITVAEIETKNIDINKRYYYDHDFGFKEVNHNIDLATSISGEDLKLLMDNNLASLTKIDNIRLIIRSIFQRLSIGKKIKSYELF